MTENGKNPKLRDIQKSTFHIYPCIYKQKTRSYNQQDKKLTSHEKTLDPLEQALHWKIDTLLKEKSANFHIGEKETRASLENIIFNKDHFEIENKTISQNNEVNNLVVNLSHDLRNSMNPLINLLPILIKSKNITSQEKIIQVIEKNVSHIQKIVEEVKQIAYIKSPETRFSIDSIDLCNEMNHIISSHTRKLQRKRLFIKKLYDDNIFVKADLNHTKTVLSHILENAIHYTPEGGIIKIKITKNTEFILLSIQDTGVGMNQEQIKYAFDEFYKGDESRQNLERNGLGLSICKYIMEKQNGKIWLESPGIRHGTTVFIKFPIIQISN